MIFIKTFCEDSNDFTNDPSVIEARFTKEMSRIDRENRNLNGRLSAFEQGKFDDDYETNFPDPATEQLLG